ncbi:BglII/BstYI family type II restriction endonuclease [Flavobacterium sp.]|uniref:BglII/BstYI family type II restriction endonuclease n=1 Tax=Flavobacterium sp. TaxID=239 RepID=UPI0025E87F9B|nr:BglII/BstYI family type II restriction endonuclease [Flavobacterium sp.]
MTQQEKENWSNTTSVNLFVTKEYFHHHAFEIINAYTELKNKFLSSLSNKIRISPRVKMTRGYESRAIEAGELNIVIRELLQRIKDIEIKFEVYEENGVFYFSSEKSSIGGFDFAILNHYNNILALRNLCFGNLQYSDGEIRWENFLKKNPDLIEIANHLKNSEGRGKNISVTHEENSTPLIVGEIQFGNWALAYRDFFKVLKADVQNSVDCLIYIVPTGNLEKMLSDGIVTFDKTKRIMEEFSKVISVPVWLIGIDVE